MVGDCERGTRRGAYGLTIEGLESEYEVLVRAPAQWPSLRVVVDPPGEVDATVMLTDSLARYPDGVGGHAVVDRARATVRFGGPRRLDTDEIVHPRLGMVGALYAQWLGRGAFHGGAFVSGGGAWAVVGERGDGKSTLMAALGLGGVTVLGDDTVVVEGGDCLAGPRCIDLRPDTAARLGCREDVVVVRRGARHRLRLGVAPAATPLAGWFFLAWGSEISVRPLPAAERLARLGRRQGWHRRAWKTRRSCSGWRGSRRGSWGARATGGGSGRWWSGFAT